MGSACSRTKMWNSPRYRLEYELWTWGDWYSVSLLPNRYKVLATSLPQSGSCNLVIWAPHFHLVLLCTSMRICNLDKKKTDIANAGAAARWNRLPGCIWNGDDVITSCRKQQVNCMAGCFSQLRKSQKKHLILIKPLIVSWRLWFLCLNATNKTQTVSSVELRSGW